MRWKQQNNFGQHQQNNELVIKVYGLEDESTRNLCQNRINQCTAVIPTSGDRCGME